MLLNKARKSPNRLFKGQKKAKLNFLYYYAFVLKVLNYKNFTRF